MKFILLSLLVFLSCQFFIEASSVKVLTSSNFDEVVDGSKFVFVKFYAPWCGHCKSMASDYEKVANEFSKNSDVVIAEVNADEDRKLGSRFEISGYPTLLFFPKSTKHVEYSGGRSYSNIVDFINSKIPVESKVRVRGDSPSYVVQLNKENIKKIIEDSNKSVFVEFYAKWCGHCKKIAPTWEKLANVFAGDDDVVIAKIDADENKDLVKSYEINGYPTLKFFKKGDAGALYTGQRDLDSLVDYVNTNANKKRLASGILMPGYGVFDELVQISQSAPGTTPEEIREKISKVAKSIGSEIDENLVKIYTRIITSVISNPEYLENEISRLNKLLEGSISIKKIDEFTVRLNILNAIKSRLSGNASDEL